MPAALPGRRRVRSVFVSDVHLGCRYSQAERFWDFLAETDPQYLYIVGDFIDGWRLQRQWHWQGVYDRILRHILTLPSRGTQVFYTPGNHDEFLRAFDRDFGSIRLADEFIHVGADGRHYLIVHGDRFDQVETRARWLSMLGARAYDLLIWCNNHVNGIRRLLRLRDCCFSSRVKICFKEAVKFISDFEQRLALHARHRSCDGVICGHIHVPRIGQIDDILYCNAGDWVEHCTALVEYEDGALELLDRSVGGHVLAGQIVYSPLSPRRFVAAMGVPACEVAGAAH